MSVWNTGTGAPQRFQLVGWRITLYPMAVNASITLNGMKVNTLHPIRIGGAYDRDNQPIPVLFEGTYQTADGYLVVVEHQDPDTR